MTNIRVTPHTVHLSRIENKIILIGNAGVGKTSIIERYTTGAFYDTSIHKTLKTDVIERTVSLNGKNYLFKIWDTAGQELYRSVTRSHYHNAKGIFLVYDMSSEESFNSLEFWTKELVENGVFDSSTCIVLGNKCDLVGLQLTRPINDLDNRAAFRDYTLRFETSAKNGKGIDEAFQRMCENIVEKHFSVSCDEHYRGIMDRKQQEFATSGCFCK